jgi:DNA-binding CsgD family transcriptional regulator
VLHHCLGAVLEAGLWIGDSAAVEALVTPPSANRQVVLTTQQRAVLKRLAEGLTQQQTADTEHLSLRTVEWTIEALKEKFDVTTTFALGMTAVCLGFVS